MQQFEIAFSGEILPGAQLEQVKAAIARLFQADDALLARLFSGQRVVIGFLVIYLHVVKSYFHQNVMVNLFM